jgi:hypothetical protein
MRVAPRAALGDRLRLAATRVDVDELEAVAPAAHGEQSGAVGVPGVLGVVGARAGELAVLRAGEVHLGEAAALGEIGDARPVG